MLVAKHHVGEALSPVVQKACDLAHIQSVAWSGKPELPAGARPALVISMLPSGERVIAEDLVGLMTRVQPGLPLLMLCSDELVRPTVSLQNGRVTLLGPPHTEERVAARLRILLADRRHDSSVGTLNYGIGAGDPRVFVNEQSTKRAYFAIASSRGNEPAGAETFAPVLDLADDRGMSALLTTTMPYMKVVIDTLKEKGMRDDYVVLVGGAPLNEEFAKAIGADAYCRDAAVAVETAKSFMARKHNQLAAS